MEPTIHLRYQPALDGLRAFAVLAVIAYHGGFSFHPMTWRDYRPDGLPKRAFLATPAEQIRVARLVLEDQGWEAWPACSKRFGLR